MLTYKLFKTQGMPLSATSRKGQPDADLQPDKNPDHAPVSNKQEEPARFWLTYCPKPRTDPVSNKRASLMLTYSLFKTQTMLLSAISRKGQLDADLQSVQNPKHAPVSNKQKGLARFWITSCPKPTTCSCEHQARASHMLTYSLFKTHTMLLSAISRKGQPDAHLHPVENPEHALVSNKQGRPARCWLTSYAKPRACSC